MRASKLHLTNFRGAKNLSLDFCPGLNLLVGVNGAGKTSVLESVAIMLSWAAARLRSAKNSGSRIADEDIHIDTATASIELSCLASWPESRDVFWRLAQTRKGRNPNVESEDPSIAATYLSPLNEWARTARDQLGESDSRANLPLFVFYPVNRTFLDVPRRIRTAHTFDPLDAYESAFTTGTNFRSFFEWFREREDLENQHLRKTGTLVEDEQLRAVREAIQAFLPDFSEICIERSPLRMVATKGDRKYSVNQMSEGEKCLFALVGDLAQRLAIANRGRDNPLRGDGIVLVDELDLHLHPAWQRMVVSRLTQTFPNCQFIVSTHSPQMFGEVEAKRIWNLAIDAEAGLVATRPTQALGLDSSEVLDEQMAANSRNQEVSDRLAGIFRHIDAEDFRAARESIQELQIEVGGSIPELVRAESLITMLEPAKDEGG